MLAVVSVSMLEKIPSIQPMATTISAVPNTIMPAVSSVRRTLRMAFRAASRTISIGQPLTASAGIMLLATMAGYTLAAMLTTSPNSAPNTSMGGLKSM